MAKTQENTDCESEINTVIKLLKDGDEKQFRACDDVIMFLGNTGAGKSTLTQFLCGHELFSQEVIENSGEFVIFDTSEKISSSTITSKTLYPDLLVDEKNNTAYYDCPGFNDTRSVAHDICSTYFNKKLIDLSKNVKIVFVVGYPAVRRGVDRQDFVLLIKHATNFIKNVEKFKDSVALVVTKVDNSCVKKDGILRLVTDDVVLESIVDFLKEVTRDWYQVENANEEGVKLVNAFLTTDKAGCYTKIALLRRPDENGEVKKISLLTDGKTKIEKVLRNLKFAQKNENDFGYTISADSKNCVFNLSIQLNKIITTYLINIGIEVQNNFNAKQTMCIDIDDFQEICQNLQQEFCDLRRKLINGPPNLNNLLLNNEIKPFKKYLEIISRHCEHLNLLQKISGIDTCNSKEWAQGLDDVIDYFSKLHDWYGFISKLHVLLSQFEIQKNINQYDTVDLINKIRTHMNKTLGEIAEFDLFMNKIDLPKYNLGYEMKKINMDEIKLKTLTRLLELHLNHPILASLDGDKLVIKGFNIKLGDVKENYFCDEIKHVQIFAMNKIFIDSDWDLTDKKIQMCVIASAWEVVGEKTIELSGAPGKNHPKPDNCKVVGETGTHGKPGLPGGSSGHFLGIGGHFYNESFLKILANGGKGGSGQNGGKGGPSGKVTYSKRRDDERSVDRKPTDLFHNFKILHEKPNEALIVGSDEGRGGDGGVGGIGGNSGEIHIIGVNRKPKVSMELSGGENGNPGKGGDPGKRTVYKWVQETEYMPWRGAFTGTTVGAGIAGLSLLTGGLAALGVGVTGALLGTAAGFVAGVKKSDDIFEQEVKPTARKGSNGANLRERKCPESVKFISNLTIPYYKSYIRENINCSLRNKYLIEFLNNLDDCKAIREMDIFEELYIELKELQNQLKLKNTIPLLPFYEKLLERIKNKSSNVSQYIKNVFNYLYCATLSSFITCSMKRVADNEFTPLGTDIIIFLDHLNEYNKSYKEKIMYTLRKNLQNLHLGEEKRPEITKNTVQNLHKYDRIVTIRLLLICACEIGIEYIDKKEAQVPFLVLDQKNTILSSFTKKVQSVVSDVIYGTGSELQSTLQRRTFLLLLKKKGNTLTNGNEDQEIFQSNIAILEKLQDTPDIKEETFAAEMETFLKNMEYLTTKLKVDEVTFNIRVIIQEMFVNLKNINICLKLAILCKFIPIAHEKFPKSDSQLCEIFNNLLEIIKFNINSIINVNTDVF